MEKVSQSFRQQGLVPTNHPRKQSWQVFTQEAFHKVYFPRHFELEDQEGLPTAGASFWRAPQHSFASRKLVTWIPHRYNVVRCARSTKTRNFFDKIIGSKSGGEREESHLRISSCLCFGNRTFLTFTIYSSSMQLGHYTAWKCCTLLTAKPTSTSSEDRKLCECAVCPRMFLSVNELPTKTT